MNGYPAARKLTNKKNIMKTTTRNLTARYFETSKLSRIYEVGRWIYTTDENLSDFTENDIKHFLRVGNYWKK